MKKQIPPWKSLGLIYCGQACGVSKNIVRIVCLAMLVCLSITGLTLTAQALTFPSTLTNDLDWTNIDSSARDIVVLIHGWEPGNDACHSGLEQS